MHKVRSTAGSLGETALCVTQNSFLFVDIGAVCKSLIHVSVEISKMAELLKESVLVVNFMAQNGANLERLKAKVLSYDNKTGIIVLKSLGTDSDDLPSDPENQGEDDDHDPDQNQNPRIHTACLRCGKSYRSSYSLRRHFREKHSEDVKYCCDKCERTFGRHYLLREHSCKRASQ